MLYRFQILLKEDKHMKRKEIVPKADGGITPCAKEEWEEKVCPDQNPPILEGFHHLVGTKAEGFVIQDEFGSEFTYVPVSELIANGTLDDGRNFNQKFGRRAFRGETFSEEAFYEKRNPALERSIKKHGGFYLSRFPISYEKGRLVSKKGNMPIVDVNFYDAERLAATFTTKNVKAILPSGAAYDSVYQWLIQSGQVPYGQVVEDSTKIGNYWNLPNFERKVLPTGSNEDWCVCNIYDLAGNTDEWSTENYRSRCVLRGGYCYDYGYDLSLVYRYVFYPDYSYSDTSFRVLLYVK